MHILGQFLSFSLNTISNGLKCTKNKNKCFLKIFGPLKIAIFGQNLKFLAKNGHFRTPRAIFFGGPKTFFDSIIFCTHLEGHFELSYAPIPQCMWSGWAKIQILGQKHRVLSQNGYFQWSKNFQKWFGRFASSSAFKRGIT